MNPETNDDMNDEDMGLSEKELAELIREIDILRNNEELAARMVIPPTHDGHSYFPRIAYVVLPYRNIRFGRCADRGRLRLVD